MSERKKIERRYQSINYDSWDSILKTVNNLKQLHPNLKDTEIEFRLENDYDGEYCYIFYQDWETDAEMNKRIERESYYKAQREEQDRQQYEALKKKFGA
jgi:hypothetical protein